MFNNSPITAYEVQLGQLSIHDLIESYLRGVSLNEHAADLTPPLLYDTIYNAINEAVFNLKKTKQLQIDIYKKAAPPEIHALYYAIEKPIRSYEYYCYMGDYLGADEMPKRTEADRERLENAHEEQRALNDTIYDLKGNWDAIMNDQYISGLLYDYSIITFDADQSEP